jgi:hypothetical protein
MGAASGPDIIESGLVLLWDAANSESYVDGSSTMYDLSKNGNNGTITNVTFSREFCGVINMAASNTSQIISNLNLTSNKNTVIGAARYSGASRGRIITANSNNWLLGHWAGGTESYYSEGTIKLTGGTPNDTNWRIYAGTGDPTADYYEFYINGKFTIGNNGGAQGPNNIKIGQQYSEVSNGQFSFLQVYNRVLTSAEILQNYNATKGRFLL